MHGPLLLEAEGETSVEIKRLNDELLSLTGKQLIKRIRLFGEVPWVIQDCQLVLVALWTFNTVLWRGAGWREALAAPSGSAKVALSESFSTIFNAEKRASLAKGANPIQLLLAAGDFFSLKFIATTMRLRFVFLNSLDWQFRRKIIWLLVWFV